MEQIQAFRLDGINTYQKVIVIQWRPEHFEGDESPPDSNNFKFKAQNPIPYEGGKLNIADINKLPILGYIDMSAEKCTFISVT